MKLAKRLTAALICCLPVTAALVTPLPAHAFGGIAKEVTQAREWGLQIKAMADELKQLQAEYKNFTEVRKLIVNLISNPEIRKYLPDDFAEVMKNGYGNWEELLKLLDEPLNNQELREQVLKKLAIDEAMSQEAYRQASKRIDEIQKLMNTLNQTDDTKLALDLQNRIQSEQAMIQNEMVKLNMLKMLQDIEQRKNAEQAYKQLRRSLKIDQKLELVKKLDAEAGF